MLETDERARLVADLLTELVAAVPGSAALLRGSLAEGRADPYSDIDLDVFARSVGRDPDYDRDNPSTRGTAWSAFESSLANAIAAIKVHRRGRDDEAAELLVRAEARIGAASPAADLQSRISLLLDAVAAKDPTTASLAADIRRLATETT